MFGSGALTWGSVQILVRLARFGAPQSVEFGAKLGAKTPGAVRRSTVGELCRHRHSAALIRSIFEQPDRDGTWDQFGVVVDQTPNQSSGRHHAP